MAYLLLVDDDCDFASAAAVVLRASGHEVAVQLETTGALESMHERAPDLVVLDVMFPEDGEAGFRLAAAIRRERGRLRDVPILMLTAISPHMPVGFGCADSLAERPPETDFIEKPVDLDHLVDRISTVLAGRA